MTAAAALDRLRPTSLTAVAAVSAYVVLGVILLVTRFAGLDRGFWHDEIFAIVTYVRPGVGEIMTGGVNHELFTLLEWITREMVGESEVAFRLWSTVPFVAGVLLVTVWLHRRVDHVSGLLFLFVATVSPLLLDISRQARGYGLAFLAMSVLVVAALEAQRTGRAWALAAFFAAGLVGSWTLPQFTIAFVAIGTVLVTDRRTRTRVALGLGASVLAVALWYAPHLGEVGDAAQIEDGTRIATSWVVTAPIDQVLLPALLWIDGTVLVAGMLWVPLVALMAILMASSPLVRSKQPLLVLSSGVVATIVVLWLADAYVVPRYISFLLVPLFMVLATGMSSILRRGSARPALLRTLVVVTAIALLAAGFARTAPDVIRLPREAHKAAAETILRDAAPHSRVVANMHNPLDLDFYLDLPMRAAEGSAVAPAVCTAAVPVVYVYQPFVVPEVDVPCLGRAGVRHVRLPQYTRGDEISVWFVPPG